MGQINTTIDLAASPEKVFATATDPTQFENWLTIHSKWKGEVPAAFTQGAKVTEVVSMLGMPNTIEWTVDDFDAPEKLSLSGTGMAGVKVQIDIAVTANGEGGSTLSLSTSFEGAMIVGAIGAAVDKDAQKQLELSLEKFQGLLS